MKVHPTKPRAGDAAHPVPNPDRRRLFAIGGLLVGGAAALHASSAKARNAIALPEAEEEASPDGPTEHQRTYYEKARF